MLIGSCGISLRIEYDIARPCIGIKIELDVRHRLMHESMGSQVDERNNSAAVLELLRLH